MGNLEPTLTIMEDDSVKKLDFENTEIAFSYKSNKELKKLRSLFRVMNSKSLVNLGSVLGPLAIKLNIPFTRTILENTIFEHFVGGENLLDTQSSIDLLYRFNTLTILDFGAESKSSEEDLNRVMNENIKAIELAASNDSVPVISTKITGLAPDELLKKMNNSEELNEVEQSEKQKLLTRLHRICKRAYELNVGVMIDAEESWMQVTIDNLVDDMMREYNKEKVIVYNTFQLYRNDKLEFLKSSFEKAASNNYKLGAKLVRGAYMDKENKYAEDNGWESVIHKTKDATDRDFDLGVNFCVENYAQMASVCATHNLKSNLYQAQLIEELGIEKNHPHINFCQLYGMSDNITFNLAKFGFNVAKYVPYGPLKEVVPYLIRRAKENTSITGDMSRELGLITKEIKRRGL